MQFSSWKSTIQFEYCTMAPGAGHAFRQPGSAQAMQPSLRINHSRSPLGFSYSAKAITDHGRERVGQETRLGEAGEAPVNGNADRVHRLAVGRERPQALGDYRHGLDEASIRGHLHAIPRSDTELFRQAFSDFDELLRLQNRVQPHVLRPVMEVLREAVSA